MMNHPTPPDKTQIAILSPFARLKQKLWRGTLVVQAILLAGVAIMMPQYFMLAVAGVGLGCLYLLSLTHNAEDPKKGTQFAFSLIRAGLFAYALVQLTDGRIPEMAIVMSGLLSYKVILTAEYVVQAMPAFRRTPLSQVTQASVVQSSRPASSPCRQDI